LATFPVSAQVRMSTDAQKLADGFWPKSRGTENLKTEMVYTEKDSAQQHPYFYVFNRGNNQGFIIVSADERSKSILGYSDSGSFDVANIPPEMKKWLRIYQGELKELILTPDSLMKIATSQHVLSKASSETARGFAPAVPPLLGDINYSQKYPYNGYCPQVGGQSCVTGCVATGAAQIMRYWKYPVEPTGKSHSYIYNGQQIGTTFNTRYNWDEMLSSYGPATGSPEQRQAVAKLMADAGIACDMAYSPNASGANTGTMAMALVTYFGYDQGVVPYVRNNMTEADFEYYLKKELNEGRPVLVAGNGAGGGHCFVCDGYDQNGLFHINWGWNGVSNGYFQMCNLNPFMRGTGGGSGGGFSDNVEFYGGIQPPTGQSQASWNLSFSQISVPAVINAGQSAVCTLSMLKNTSLYDFNGQVGVALFQGGEASQVLAPTPIQLTSQYAFESLPITVTLPSQLAQGKYLLVVVCKEQSENMWHPCMNKYNNCLELTVTAQGNCQLQFNLGVQQSSAETQKSDMIDDGFWD